MATLADLLRQREDSIQATPQNFLGPFSNAVNSGVEWLKSPVRSQQMQGLGALFDSTQVPKVLEMASYGEPMTTGKGMTTKPKPEVIEALMNVAPFAPELATAGKAVGKGAAKLAGDAVNEAMVYGRGPLASITPQPMRMDVWHGSPHGPFTKFDPSKARTGEGNATFGEGAYLAQARGTGETYRNVLSASKQMDKLLESDDMSAKIAANTLNIYKTPTEAINVLEDSLTPNLTAEAKKVTTEAIDVLKNLDKNAGYLYKVDLPDEQIAKMLDYDKPLSQQAPEVQAALAELGIKVDKKKIDEFHDALLNALESPDLTPVTLPKAPRDWRGQQILQMLELNPSQYFPQVMEGKELTGAMINPKSGVSQLLSKKGIPGVRYLDQMSRDAGEGTSNFVVFPKYQDLLTIKEINDKPVDSLVNALRNKQ